MEVPVLDYHEPLDVPDNMDVSMVKTEENLDSVETGQHQSILSDQEPITLDIINKILNEGLQKLDLFVLQMEEYLIVQRRKFDLRISGEPFVAMQLLLNLQDLQYIVRIWGQTCLAGSLESLKDFEPLCSSVFDKTVTCLGMSKETSEPHNFVGSKFPFNRPVSEYCAQFYSLSSGSPNPEEQQGIGLCSYCKEGFEVSYGDEDLNMSNSSMPKVECPAGDDLLNPRSSSSSSVNAKVGGKKKRLNPGGPENVICSRPTFSKTTEEGKAKFVCGLCPENFNSKSGWNTHAKKKHMYGAWTCEECTNVGFKFADEFYMHYSRVHPDTEFKCPCCQDMGFGQDMEGQFEDHYRMCKKQFFVKLAKLKNEKYQAKEKQFQCDICGNKFPSRIPLEEHVNDHNGIKPHKCTEEGCGFATSFKDVLLWHHLRHLKARGDKKGIEALGKTIHVCEHCGFEFLAKRELRLHVERKHLNIKKEIKCNICDHVCFDISTHRRHLKIYHFQEERLRCKECGKYFGSPAYLREHMKLHQDPTFKCQYCGKMLKRERTLQAHIRTHTGENPYKCNWCNYACKDGSVLRKHTLARHPEMVK